jgi:hypothetical protein
MQMTKGPFPKFRDHRPRRRHRGVKRAAAGATIPGIQERLSAPNIADPAFEPAIREAIAICRQVASELGAADVAHLGQVLAIADPLRRLRALQAWCRKLLEVSHASRRLMN